MPNALSPRRFGALARSPPHPFSHTQSIGTRVASLPLVSSAYGMVSTAYASTKESHPYVRSVCDVAEKGVKTLTAAAVSGAQPLLTKLEPQSEWGWGGAAPPNGMGVLRETVPGKEMGLKRLVLGPQFPLPTSTPARGWISWRRSCPSCSSPRRRYRGGHRGAQGLPWSCKTQGSSSPLSQLISDTKQLVTSTVTGAKDVLTSTVAGAKDAVSSRVTGVMDMTKGAVQGSVELTKSAVSSGVSTVMGSAMGQMVVSGVGSVLEKSEELVDHYLPMTDEELGKDPNATPRRCGAGWGPPLGGTVG